MESDSVLKNVDLFTFSEGLLRASDKNVSIVIPVEFLKCSTERTSLRQFPKGNDNHTYGLKNGTLGCTRPETDREKTGLKCSGRRSSKLT